MPLIRRKINKGAILFRYRRHLTPSQLAMVGNKARTYYDQQAKERMMAGKKGDPVEGLPQGKARDAAGKAVGVSGKLVDHARKVSEEGNPGQTCGGLVGCS